MRKFKTWKQFQIVYGSSPKRESFSSFFKDELLESRRIVRNVISEKPIMDFRFCQSHAFNIIIKKNAKGG